MKAIRIVGHGAPLELREIPDPTPGAGEAVLHVRASGICRSDWHGWMGDWDWLGASGEIPRTPGHELVGEVVAVGADVDLAPGARVTVPFHEACGRCHYCHTGRANLCDNQTVLGLTHDGGYAEFVSIPNADFNCVAVPDEVSDLAASAMGCRFMTAFHAVTHQGQVRPGEWVAVHGAGGLGLSTVQIASAAGARVVAVDIDQEKITLAEKHGAVAGVNGRQVSDVPAAIEEITGGGADVSVDALGVRETIRNSVLCLRKSGRHVQVGMTGSDEAGAVDVPIDVITTKELHLVGGLGNPHTAYAPLLSLVASGRLRPDALVQNTVPLAEAGTVLAEMSDYRTVGLTVIDRF
jgi:D-arabinose 1-dehydrogenase-like Zn-dependent alcohol dehydrogenase